MRYIIINCINSKFKKKSITLIILLIFSLIIKYKIIILKNRDDFALIENFTKKNLNGYLKYSKLKNYKMKNPKISVIISVFNGEGYIKPIVRSIQNQDFLDLEIIIVDDFSKDNSIQMIKELMKDDPRIILLKNKENKGTLYTKTRGVLYAKGKYVITLDHDNLYSSKYCFSYIYKEAEKWKLDLLGFSSIDTSIHMKNLKEDKYHNYIQTSIISKPFIKLRVLNLKFNKMQSETLLCLYLIKK